MAVLGLRFCARAFSSCGKWGPLFIAVHGPLTIAASLVAEHRLQMRRLSNCGSRASCSAACGIFPDQGSNPCPLHWQADSQPLRHQGSPGLILEAQMWGPSCPFRLGIQPRTLSCGFSLGCFPSAHMQASSHPFLLESTLGLTFSWLSLGTDSLSVHRQDTSHPYFLGT